MHTHNSINNQGTPLRAATVATESTLSVNDVQPLPPTHTRPHQPHSPETPKGTNTMAFLKGDRVIIIKGTNSGSTGVFHKYSGTLSCNVLLDGKSKKQQFRKSSVVIIVEEDRVPELTPSHRAPSQGPSPPAPQIANLADRLAKIQTELAQVQLELSNLALEKKQIC